MTTDRCECEGRCLGGSEPSVRRVNRREFVQAAGAGGAALAMLASGMPVVAGPFTRRRQGDHFVPADKRLTREWLDALFARGEPTWYSGDELDRIGMPVGGLCAGQVYLTGDGRLACWDIFNRNRNTGYGAVNYQPDRTAEQTVEGGRVVSSLVVDQGVAIRVRSGERTVERTLDREGFPGARFCGEYPIGRVRYADDAFPVTVELEAFSPFIPLDAADSSLPVTVLTYTVRSTSEAPAEVTLAGWLENVVCPDTGPEHADRLVRRNEAFETDALMGVVCSVRGVAPPAEPERPPTVFAAFDGDDYGDWTVEGEAFGTGPARGTLPDQNPVSGFDGAGLVNTYLDGDGPHGQLRSPAFTIERRYIAFLIGGGGHEGRTCVNLIVDGAVVRTATGRNNERLEPHNWDVGDLRSRRAHIEIVDAESGGWGHVNVDRIEFRDSRMVRDPGPLERWPDWGSICLAMAGGGQCVPSVLPGPMPERAFDGEEDEPIKSIGEPLRGVVSRTLSLGAGEEATVTFVVSWWMPNLYRDDVRVGNRYAARFDGAPAVAEYVGRNLDRLAEQTRLWHRTYFDSTLPRWLLDRLHSTAANLATTTCQWWDNGRFWAWEGCGCCRGTCGHVWNYEHALARLFPELERSVREMQDFAPGAGFHPDTGAIGFRGEGWTLWAGDSQGGYVLKAYREHQTAPDDGFLRRNWPAIRKAVQFLIEQDGNADGLIEGSQHQTYDENYFGANTMVGSLYLGALRAAEEMAREVGDEGFAETCRRVFEAGRENSAAGLFNGEYYVQDVDLEEHPDWQYADGCLSDQMFGQGWAHQVGLGYLYPERTVVSTLEAIWRYNWAPDVGPQNAAHAPERWFALPGEAGLFTCTWPKSPHLGPRSTRYRNEIWTGIEYQVAGHMAWEGMVTEALAICRGVHERYHPAKHNPWNEIECGDHYARAMASWGVLTALSGFEHHGPRRHIGFAPRIAPDDFRAAFTAAQGWGSFAQRRGARTQTDEIGLRWGRLSVETVVLAVPSGARVSRVAVTLNGAQLDASFVQEGTRLRVALPEGTAVEAGGTLVADVGLGG